LLVESGGGILVRDAAGLTAELARLLADPALRAKIGGLAHEAVAGRHGAVKATLDLVERFLLPAGTPLPPNIPAHDLCRVGSAVFRRRPRPSSAPWPVATADFSAPASGCTSRACFARGVSGLPWSPSVTSPSAAPARRRRWRWPCRLCSSSVIGRS